LLLSLQRFLWYGLLIRKLYTTLPKQSHLYLSLDNYLRRE